MEINRTRSPDLFTAMFTPATTTASWIDEDDLNEADVLWTDSDSSPSYGGGSFMQPKSPGVLAALNDGDSERRILFQKNRSFVDGDNTAISRSLPCTRLQHSAPMQIPSLSKGVMRNSDEENDLTLPPHEIVAVKVKMTTLSVLEGAGRTLKGRDLAQVRNAVWLQTGFID